MALTPPTTVTPEALALAWSRPEGDAKVTEALTTAVGLLETATAEAFRPVPQGVMDDMVRRVARACWEADRLPSRGGSSTTQMVEGNVVRPSRDPLAAVGPMLSRYVVGLG